MKIHFWTLHEFSLKLKIKVSLLFNDSMYRARRLQEILENFEKSFVNTSDKIQRMKGCSKIKTPFSHYHNFKIDNFQQHQCS